jgi:peptidoglycan/LPS O-acetylase OafA/YrhL
MIPKTSQTGRISELDGLRGVAISLVVVYHYLYFNPGAGHQTTGVIRTVYVHLERFFALGWTGVDLFFVLSGFLIGGILLDVRASPNYFKTFYLRRFYRIVPIYYLWIAAYILVCAFSSEVFRPRMTAGLFLFLQNFGFEYHSQMATAWFLPAWSLAVEEQFYLLAPLVIRLVSRRGLYTLLATVIAAAPILRTWIHYHVPYNGVSLSLAYTLMPCRADALAIGILMALLWRNRTFRAWLGDHGYFLYALTGVFLVGFAILGALSPSLDSLPMQSVGYTWIAIFYALVMILAMTRSAGPIAVIARTRWLAEIGRVSYCLYLIHDEVRFGWQLLIAHIFPHVAAWELVAANGLAAVIAYLIARLSWAYFENPLLRRGHEFKY